ncbi:quinonprotein [Sorangium cellulosum]|uniref:Quinonprotein n=1 Tax=Sorangium cellulosum TaxID=56 RepID=A0A2L0EUK1_SORCE|nr:PQQ-binding-like beta-propeller repeat protein [Sorangium cellulosum]AUX42971.1 quinonprotein [Sorangium cellulosum]
MRLCRSCGASLEAGDGGGTCPRCGADDPVATAAAPGPRAPDAAPAAGPPKAVKVALAAAMAVVGVGFAVMFVARVDPPQDPAPRSRRATARPGASARSEAGSLGPAGAPLATYLDALCFADANGDDVPDPVVWQDGETRGQVVAVDGRSGQGIWASQPFEKPDALACPDRTTVLAGGEEDPTLRALDARTGKERWAAKLPAVPDEVVRGDGCVTVLMKDGATAGIKLDGGEVADCPGAPPPAATAGRFWERKRNPQVVQVGDVEVALTAKTDGQPTLAAEGRRGTTSLWKQSLPARAPVSGGRPDLFLAGSGGAAVVLGVDGADASELRILALDPASGAIRYERAAGHLGGKVAAVKASGPYVYVVSGAALRAVDPATGDAVWRATAPPKAP